MKYNKYIDRWFEIVENEEIKTCIEQKLMVKWLKNKLDTEDIIIKHEEIEKAIVTKEKWFSYPLLDWEKFLDACEYGLYYKDGSLVFNEFFIMAGRGFGKNNLYRDLQFYRLFPEIFPTVMGKSELLTWSHYDLLFAVDNEEARNWYAHEAFVESWSVRTLRRNISSQYYFRLLQSQNKQQQNIKKINWNL